MLEPGTVVDRYRIEAVVASGGMATVYRVRHVQLGSEHALKVLDLPNQALKDRLLQEGQVQARLNHPNLVRVTDVVPVGEGFGLVMEFINGPTLEQWIEAAGALPADPAERQARVGETERIFRGILAAVSYAHRKGLVHRDLKPQNVLLEDNDGVLNPKVLDFGIAKLLQDQKAGHLTQTGWGLGTPEYMAPEQLKAAKDVDARADIWALGCMLYAMYAGKSPFARDDLLQTFTALGTGQHEPLEDLHPSLPPRLGKAVRACLRVTREERIPDCARLSLILSGDSFAPAEPTEELRILRPGVPIATTPVQEIPPAPPSSPPPPPSDPSRSAPIPPVSMPVTDAPPMAPRALTAGQTLSVSMFGEVLPVVVEAVEPPVISRPSLPPRPRATGGTLDLPADEDPFAPPPAAPGRWMLYGGIALAGLCCAAAITVLGYWEATRDPMAGVADIPGPMPPDPAETVPAPLGAPVSPGKPAPPGVSPVAGVAVNWDPGVGKLPGVTAVPASPEQVAPTPSEPPAPTPEPALPEPALSEPALSEPALPEPAPAPDAALVLSDDAQIASMVKKVLTSHADETDACYTSRLAESPDLAGSWKLDLTVEPDGSADEIEVKALGASDAGLESCLAAAAARWRFTPIDGQQPTTKTYRFGTTASNSGTLVIQGDARDAWLVVGGTTYRAGKVPSGPCGWGAQFESGDASGSAVVPADGTLTLECHAAQATCEVK